MELTASTVGQAGTTAPVLAEPDSDLATDLNAQAAAAPAQPAGGEVLAEAAPETSEEQHRALLSVIEKEYGADAARLVGKYGSDADFVQGALNAMRLVGVRDADAELGKSIRGRESDFYAFLQAQQQQQAQPSKPPAKDEPPEWRPEWEYQVERDPATGELRPVKGAPADIVQKVQRATTWMQDRMRALLFEPEKALEPIVQKAVTQAVQQAQTAVGNQLMSAQEQNACQQFAEKSKDWIWVGGNPQNGLTPQGEQFARTCQYIQGTGVKSPMATIQHALAYMRAGAAQPSPAQPPGPAARHKPNVAAPQRTKVDEDKLIETETLEQSLLRRMREQKPA